MTYPTRGRRRPSTRTNAQPEHMLQMQVREYLLFALPPEIEWTANAAGVFVSPLVASKMKAAGVRRGWADLQFLFPDGVTRYIELKAPKGTMSVEQHAFAARCHSARPDLFACCRTLDQVVAALTGWGAKLRAVPAGVLVRNAPQPSDTKEAA